MNIISTGLASKKRVLLARQHCEVKKSDLEKCLSSFTRLMEKHAGDHTFVETETNRFLYQPVDEYYVFVMTSLDSNIVGDIAVVKMLAEIVQAVVQPELNEETIQENLFELIFHMDEIISNNKREELTLDQIREYILMDSQEEKVHNMIQTSKEKEEKERRKQIAAKLEKRKELDHTFVTHATETPPYVIRSVAEHSQPMTSSNVSQVQQGMKLSIPRVTNELTPLSLSVMRNVSSPKTSKDEESINILDAEAPVVVQIMETCSGSVHLEGEIDVLNVQGELVMTAFEEGARMASLEISGNLGTKMRYHPNLSKQMTAKNLIEPISAQQAHKIGHSTSFVKWRHKSTEEKYFPIALSCWPNTTGGQTTVTVEVQNTSDMVLEVVNFRILDSRYNQVAVNEHELGTVQRNPDSINWVIEGLETKQSGRFEFTTNGDLNSILPFTLVARMPGSITQLKVIRCYDKNTGDDINHVVKTQTSFSITIGNEGT